MGDLTRDFDRSEFECPCGCGFDLVSWDLLHGLQRLRIALGLPVVVLSGCRCVKHNAAVGGASGSQHLKGRAADVRVAGMKARPLYRVAARLGIFHGFGVDEERGFVHLDVRPGKIAKWCYRGGKEVAWHE